MSDRTVQHPAPDAGQAFGFADRHIGPGDAERGEMLKAVGYSSAAELMRAALPAGILDPGGNPAALRLPEAAGEQQALGELRGLASRNQVLTSMIGLGYYDTVTPPVILRNILENPAWYTAYTPYQPEISQGRLEALLNFQTMVADLTGLPVAGASLLDEATAAAEAMTLARRASKARSSAFVVDADVFPQTLDVLRTRAEPLGIDIVVADLSKGLPEGDAFGVLAQYPAAGGAVRDLAPLMAAARERGAIAVVAADILALTVLRSPGDMGADIAVGSTQRFGVPMGFGGPHAGYMSVGTALQRQLPGRLVGVSKDSAGRPAYRLALQTREQHIRREKATSNICTAQVLLAVMAGTYAVYHGPAGLRAIAERVHAHTVRLADGLRARGFTVLHDAFFDTLRVRVPAAAAATVDNARRLGVNLLRVGNDTVGISCDEATTDAHVDQVLEAFGGSVRPGAAASGADTSALPADLRRDIDYLDHPVFNTHRSETSLLRYLRRLADKDLALDRTMIPLGSCTMKLNATAEMEAITWPEFAGLHPLAPLDQAAGSVQIVRDLEGWLAEVTGYDAVSLQPNAGSQGELAGLLAIRGYHRHNGETGRDVCLIPSSAHGTNAASAVMAGMRVVVVACDDGGNVDLADLAAKCEKHRDSLAAIMVTYPSTHGVYEDTITEVCRLVHESGGQVYVDGANLNALLGWAKPGAFGADVSHLNLHKTFCIPHGGGGPGVGPVAVREHLSGFLPNHPGQPEAGPYTGVGPVSAAPFGSAGILPISWAYIRMMGEEGLRSATEMAVLGANYIAKRLSGHYPVLYTGAGGLVAHECIIDIRQIAKQTGITNEDVAKRLIDYGFHAPTMSFPVAGTLMVEPTESEDLAELDRFIDAMIAIKGEIDRVADGGYDPADNPLKGAPHTAEALTADTWDHAYTRSEAGYPVPELRQTKYWVPVSRIDQAFGDRNLVCSCPPPEAFEE
ncbi:glycine dehydrogenase (decarboxylating) alpha subunit /glycine dehydrogenase (decarboxylating) beta subunit [Murinocardiopsis flavida]|uniref:Glycine dehydrogenase (decarboxylating) n=1 Tax=Murinocardiopsis flavida TaxID=645275 RepID=A0A2P8DSE7_9ACTN|nr:aminomethyl-transferring glycine dehydrogenase [Murinocardiopsis flavida]PSL00137.1 glycine dehydrogenase (decarboxylating) alpha subunit /glycine dehydrogenase (decarboxylating) beta subunit [Murinocardiopsis flavida]